MTPILYFFVSLFIGFLGYNKTMGFWGYFFGSLIFTPLVGIILVIVSSERNKQ